MGWTLAPLIEKVARRVLASPSIYDVAVRSWDVHPADSHPARQAVFLPGQLERVTGWKFSAEDPRPEMAAGWEHRNPATRAFLLRDAVLMAGSLYKGRAKLFYDPSGWRPRFRVEQELDRAAAFCSYNGHKWFANWLVDDCVTYPLAFEEAVPVTTCKPSSGSMAEYEHHFGMEPRRLDSVRFRELVIFDDESHNLGWKQRYDGLRAKLRSHFPARATHPGVFVLRGSMGEPRVLDNELELAHHLRDTRGFTIVAPEQEPLSAVASKCAGAEVVVGIEGSQLFNGILLLPDTGSVLAIQPADRFVSMIKNLMDREEKTFGLVVASKTETGYHCDRDELDRTLDLLASVCGDQVRGGAQRHVLGR